jgi:hypothetical protein
VLTREPISVPEAIDAASRVGAWRPDDADGHGWLDDRPIFLAHEPETWEDYDQASLRALHRILGWSPSDRLLVVGAMCNQPIDHRLIAQVALAVLSGRDGVIDYGGPLEIESTGLPGWALSLRYEMAAGGYAQSAIVSPDWLAGWLAEPTFRLIK